MKITKYMGAFAVIAMLAACSTDDEQGTNTAANEVKITANVGGNSIFTRSNPLGTEAEQQSFNENDVISVTTEGNSLQDYLQSIGVEYGRNLNAYTSVEKTVYYFTDVPTTRPTAVDSCMLILKDWSNGISLAKEAIKLQEEMRHQTSLFIQQHTTSLVAFDLLLESFSSLPTPYTSQQIDEMMGWLKNDWSSSAQYPMLIL